jgi:glycosyltransferase involved in cell wall biosynthesis
MKVAVVHDWLFERRGGERVLEAILGLFPEADVYALFGRADPSTFLQLAPGSRHVFRFSFLQSVPFIGKLYKHFLPLLPVAIEALDLTGYDLVVSSSHCVAKGVIVAPQARHVCYIHSVMRYAWDQEHRYFPRAASIRTPLELLRRFLLSRLRVWDVTSAARIDSLVANSAYVARRVKLYYGREASVVHPNVGVERFEALVRKEAPESERTVLLFGAWVPYKRMGAAFDTLVANGISVVAAGHGADLLAAKARYEKEAPSAKVEFVLNPDDAAVEALFARCHVLLFPAIEDFGIVPVEATAAGLWVVAPNVGGTAETVVPGVTGFPFPEGDSKAMVAAVLEALAKPVSKSTREAMTSHARRFALSRFQNELLAEIEKALAK